MSARYLHRILFPESIVVFGEGDKEAPLADVVLNNILSAGYKGRVFSVCSGTGKKGLTVYPDIEEIEGPVDLGVLAAPPGGLLKAIPSFGKIKPAGVIIASEANLTSEFCREMLICARSAGIRLIGPHSWGVLNPMANLNAGFANQPVFGGELAVVSQSSAICATILDLSVSRKIGIGFLIGLGDMIDVDFADVIDYLTNNARVRAILLHVESLKNLRQFMSASRAAARIKPVIVLKTDRHQGAFSIWQTPGMERFNDISLYDAVFKRAGIIRVETVEGLFDCAELVSKKVRPTGAKLVIITDSKTPGAMAVDALLDRGVSPVVLNDATIDNLDRILSPSWSRNNPICTRSELTPEVFEKIVSCLVMSEIDGILVILSPQFIANSEMFAGYLSMAVKQIKKPVFVAWMGGDRVVLARRILNDAGISTNETPERAVRAFLYLYTYALNQRLLQEIPSRSTEFSFAASNTRKVIESIIHRRTNELSEFESIEILGTYGFSVRPARLLSSTEDASSRIDRVAHTIHASDINIVMGARMISDLGPVIFMGPYNGISKIIHDCAIGLPPLNQTLARHMVESSPILVRFLEANSRDMESSLRICEELIIRLSHLVTDFPEISAIDMDVSLIPENQVVVTGSKMIVTFSSTPSPLHLIISPYPNQYERYATDKSGRSLFIRPMKPEDAQLLQRLWSTFSSKTLYYRFSKQIKELSPELLVSLTQIDYDREIALVAIQSSESGDEMLGVGRLYGAIGADISEFSVVVGDPWQGLGIGAKLLSNLILIAKDRKIKMIWGLIQRENKNMIELARSLNFTIIGDSGDPQVEATLTIYR
ncbi:MAG: acetate--CoA ligase family protein [Desulfobacterales bacterium]|nr:acetate--CoA ligase family protein [Desulfobacterales bacterium]